MKIPEYIRMSEASPIVGLPPHRTNAYGRESEGKFMSEAGGTGRHRKLSTAIEVPVLCFFADLLREGFTVKHAGRMAARVKEGMEQYPRVDQLTTVTLEIGSTFTLPSDQVDLDSGYNSGGYVRSALTVDIRNLRRRVEAALIGGGDA